MPQHKIGPCEDEQEFNEYLIRAAGANGFDSKADYEEALRKAKSTHAMKHPVVFTHGDLQTHNLLVHQGRLSGFLDWESAGWYPDYWDFATAMKRSSREPWWGKALKDLFDGDYLRELESDRALHCLTIDSFIW